MSNIPAYMNIRQYVVDLVTEHHDTDIPIMSERELCRQFGVSRTTVRNALADLVADGWLYTKPGLGMFINSQRERNSIFTLRKSYKILILTGDGKMAYLDGFFMRLLSVTFEKFCKLPVRLRLVNLSGGNDSALEELKMHHPDGIIWFSPFSGVNHIIAALRELVPVYVVGNISDGNPYNVTTDYYRVGRMAASWFLDRSRKNVVFAGYQPDLNIKTEIFRGWQEEYRDRQLQYDLSMVISTADDVIKKGVDLLRRKTTQGVFVLNCSLAAIDMAWREAGMASSPEPCPVMTEWNVCELESMGGAIAARITGFSTETVGIAAESLYARLSDPEFQPREVVVAPRIENVAGN